MLTLPAFPTSVMGTVVNKRAKYNYLRLVQANEKLTYRFVCVVWVCSLGWWVVVNCCVGNWVGKKEVAAV